MPFPAAAAEALSNLTEVVLASDQLEDLGKLIVVQLSEDLIGEPDQSDDDEELIDPSPREAAFLRDLFVRLLTPQSVLDLYTLGQTPMAVAIQDARTLEVLAEGVLSGAGDVVAYDIPHDGWYILSKDAAEGEEGTAILSVKGIHPVVERTLSATASRFVRLTDNELVVTESRPQVDGKNIAFAVLIDNQFRGLRDLDTYLVHFIPPFFEQVEALLLPLRDDDYLGLFAGTRRRPHAWRELRLQQSRKPLGGAGLVDVAPACLAGVFRTAGWRRRHYWTACAGLEDRGGIRRRPVDAPRRELAEPQQ